MKRFPSMSEAGSWLIRKVGWGWSAVIMTVSFLALAGTWAWWGDDGLITIVMFAIFALAAVVFAVIAYIIAKAGMWNEKE